MDGTENFQKIVGSGTLFTAAELTGPSTRTAFKYIDLPPSARYNYEQIELTNTGVSDAQLVDFDIACITRISCPRDGAIAVLEGMIYASSSDGETAPLAYTQNATLPALLANDQAYTVGPFILNGTEVGGIESFDFDPKINVRLNRADGQPYPTFAYIARRGDEQDGPSVIMSTRHLEKIAAGSTQPITALSFASLRSLKAGAFARRRAP